MNLKSFEEIKIADLKEYKSFAEEIDYLIDFFKSFAELIFYNGRIISFLSEEKIHYLDTSLIDSATQTLRSIKLCCSIGSFSDANTLTRKLRDDLIQYVYILDVINRRNPFIEEDLKNLKTGNPEELADSFSNIRFNNELNNDEKAVSAWLSNTVSKLSRPIKRKLEFENYMNMLKQNSNIVKILEQYNLKEYWEILRKRLNDYVHNNGRTYSVQNNTRFNNPNTKVQLKNVNIRTSYISSFFVVALSMIDSSMFLSSDYMDHLNCDMEPPEKAEYFIARFIQDFIDVKISKLHPELKQYLKDNNNYNMNIE